MKFKYCTVVVLLFQMMAIFSYGQVKELKIGDKVPDMVIRGILNYPDQEIRTAELKGKLIILSFWSTSCSSCIAAMPKMDFLQKKFGDRILILPVTDQKKEYIEKFWSKNHITKSVSLSTVTDDVILSKYFKHYGVPYEVWIDGDGVVKGLTTAQYVNEENILKLLNKEPVDWPINKKLNKEYNFEVKLLTGRYNFPEDKRPDYYAAVLPSINGVISNYKAGFTPDSVNGLKRFLCVNYPILDLYRSTLQFTELSRFRNRIILEVKDSLRYFYDSKKAYRENWLNKNAYCYEAVYPITISNREIKEAMRLDLNRSLNINGRIEKREVDCWVIVKLKQGIEGTKGQPGKNQLSKGTVYSVVPKLLASLNYMQENPPVLDETGISEVLNIRLSGALTNLEGLKKDLVRYGLDIISAKRNLDMLVLTER